MKLYFPEYMKQKDIEKILQEEYLLKVEDSEGKSDILYLKPEMDNEPIYNGMKLIIPFPSTNSEEIKKCYVSVISPLDVIRNFYKNRSYSINNLLGSANSIEITNNRDISKEFKILEVKKIN